MRHRKCRGLYRAALLLTLVLGAGSGVTLLLRNVPAFAGFLDWDADEPSEYTQKTENLPVDAPLMILSRGYGFREELDPTEPQSEMANAEATDPGPKPYPQEWNLTGGEIHPVTYTAYSGEYYIDLEKAGQVLNKTSVPNSTLYTESKLRPAMKIELHGDPQVLIMHTHTPRKLTSHMNVRITTHPSTTARRTTPKIWSWWGMPLHESLKTQGSA